MRRKEMSKVKTVWWKRARSAITGRFIKLRDALLNRSTSVVEKVWAAEGQNVEGKQK